MSIHSAPFYEVERGIRTEFGVTLPPSQGEAFYVSATKFTNSELEKRRRSTLAAALSLCSADRGDYVYVMQGHAENVSDGTMLDNLVDGTTIIGCGSSMADNAPKFTWTNASGKWTVNNTSVRVLNLRLTAGANNITEMIEISGIGNEISGCFFESTTSASADAVKTVDVNGALECRITNNFFLNKGGGSTESSISTQAGGGRLVISGNVFECETQGDNDGIIQIDHAFSGLYILDNVLNNNRSTGDYCIELADEACTGMVARNLMRVRGSGAGAASGRGINIAGTTNLVVGFAENYTTDESGASAILSPAAAT